MLKPDAEKTSLITIGKRGLPIRYSIGPLTIEPAVVLAPMEGVTNLIFRRLIRQIGGLGLSYTEFIASKALQEQGKKILEMARFDPDERPVAIQIYGRDPKTMAHAAKVVEDLGASIVDINMGCPSKQVCSRSGGSALMKEPNHAIKIVQEVRKAISIPLTVKMRSGFDAQRRNAPELAYMCQEEGAQGITIHWRTTADKYGGQRQIDKIAQTVARLNIPVIGNGDVIDIPSAVQMFQQTGCHGVMIGRGAMRNPWVFQQISDYLYGREPQQVSAEERKRILLAFLMRYHEKFRHEKATLGKFKQIAKYFCLALPNGAHFRKCLLHSQHIDEVIEHVQHYFDLQKNWIEG